MCKTNSSFGWSLRAMEELANFVGFLHRSKNFVASDVEKVTALNGT